jgi:hypothetical protein
MISEEDRQHLETLQQTHQRRLRVLEMQYARQGPRTPPEVLIEIEDVREEIAKINSRLNTNTYSDPKESSVPSVAAPSPTESMVLPPSPKVDPPLKTFQRIAVVTFQSGRISQAPASLLRYKYGYNSYRGLPIENGEEISFTRMKGFSIDHVNNNGTYITEVTTSVTLSNGAIVSDKLKENGRLKGLSNLGLFETDVWQIRQVEFQKLPVQTVPISMVTITSIQGDRYSVPAETLEFGYYDMGPSSSTELKLQGNKIPFIDIKKLEVTDIIKTKDIFEVKVRVSTIYGNTLCERLIKTGRTSDEGGYFLQGPTESSDFFMLLTQVKQVDFPWEVE